jgi:hypothetical protein
MLYLQQRVAEVRRQRVHHVCYLYRGTRMKCANPGRWGSGACLVSPAAPPSARRHGVRVQLRGHPRCRIALEEEYKYLYNLVESSGVCSRGCDALLSPASPRTWSCAWRAATRGGSSAAPSRRTWWPRTFPSQLCTARSSCVATHLLKVSPRPSTCAVLHCYRLADDAKNAKTAIFCTSSPRSDYEHFEGGADGCPTEGAQRVSGLLQLLRTRPAHALMATGGDDVVLGRVQA